MNKERLELVAMVRDVVRASTPNEEEPSRRMARVIESRLDTLIAAEKRAIVQMENYKHNATTAANYDVAVWSLEILELALEASIDEYWERVDDLLTQICEPEDEE